MGLGRTIALIFTILLVVYVSFLVGPFAGLVVILIITVTLAFVLTRDERRARQRTHSWKPMSLRKFIGLLGIVALLAILYSPSALQLPVKERGTISAQSSTLQ